MGRYHDELLGGSRGKPLLDGQPSPSYMVEAGLGPVRMQYFAPPGPLRRYFGSIYLFSSSVDHYSDVTRADVPQLRFMLSGTGHYHFHDGRVAQTPDICILGPTMGATRFDLDTPARVLGVSLLPAGWLSLGGRDANLFIDQVFDPRPSRDGAFSTMLSNLLAMNDDEAMVNYCWSVLSDWIVPLPSSTWRMLEEVDAWLMGEGSPRIEVLVERTGLSHRQLARLTNRYYGCPPKLLARKYRALRCSARIALDGHSWQDLCEDGRFYDQSHFIREIKHFVGLTPHQLQTEPTAVAQLTLLRRSLGGDVALLNRFS